MLENMSKEELIAEIKRLRQFTICGCDGKCDYRMLLEILLGVSSVIKGEIKWEETLEESAMALVRIREVIKEKLVAAKAEDKLPARNALSDD